MNHYKHENMDGPQALARDRQARERKGRESQDSLRSGFSEHRAVTVEDVFANAGKLGKDGKWREGPVLIIGSGHGQRIYPPRPRRPERPAQRAMIKVFAVDRKFNSEEIFDEAERWMQPSNLWGRIKVTFFSHERHLKSYCSLVCRDGQPWRWEWIGI